MKLTRQTKVAAIVTINSSDRMTKKGRSDIAKWLRKQADYLVLHGKHLSGKTQTRYLYDITIGR